MQECAGRLLREDCPAYTDGKQALYILKLMLVKMAHKDWTPIDRQWITSQAKRLRANMPAVCHFGCEGAISEGKVRATSSLTTASAAAADEIPDTRDKIRCEVKIQPALLPLIQSIRKHLEAAGKGGNGTLQRVIADEDIQTGGEGETISNFLHSKHGSHAHMQITISWCHYASVTHFVQHANSFFCRLS
jgi:hypothetical protein